MDVWPWSDRFADQVSGCPVDAGVPLQVYRVAHPPGHVVEQSGHGVFVGRWWFMAVMVCFCGLVKGETLSTSPTVAVATGQFELIDSDVRIESFDGEVLRNGYTGEFAFLRGLGDGQFQVEHRKPGPEVSTEWEGEHPTIGFGDYVYRYLGNGNPHAQTHHNVTIKTSGVEHVGAVLTYTSAGVTIVSHRTDGLGDIRLPFAIAAAGGRQITVYLANGETLYGTIVSTCCGG